MITLDDEELMILHRHWMWANVIKKNFEIEIQKQIDSGIRQDAEEMIVDRYGAYMSIWYGMLFGVLEELRNKQISIPSIDQDINDVYDSLRLFRNAVFHPQKEYWSGKLFKIMERKESAKKLWKIHKHLGGLFLSEMKIRTKQRSIA